MLRARIKADVSQLADRVKAFENSTNFHERIEYAAALLFAGRNNEAVGVLEKLETEKPGDYVVAANLGTAYELSGDNAKALHWIEESIRRNSDAHDGTEWLHAEILKAKLAQERDPDYFKKHSVLNLNAEELGENIKINDRSLSRDELMRAIQYQLKERLQFVKPPDAPVASLLFDYAALDAAKNSLESAKTVLQMALEYGYPSERIQPLFEKYDRLITWRKTKQYTLWASIPLLLICGLVYSYKRGWFVLRR